MTLLRGDAARNNSEATYLNWAENATDRSQYFRYKNYFLEQMNWIKPHIMAQEHHWMTNAKDPTMHMQLIDRCFYSNSVEEIMRNLRRENHPFAKACLERMENNSMLSMQLALQMMRRARNLDYKGCMQMELDVGVNKIRDTDFDVGMQQVLNVTRPKGEKRKKPNF